MDIKTLAVIVLLCGCVSGDCSSGVQNCLREYLSKVSADVYSFEKLCGDIEFMVKCTFSQGCPIDVDSKQSMIKASQAQMDVLHCSFTMQDLINRYENNNENNNGASFLSSTYIHVILAVGVSLFYMKRYVNVLR